MQQHRYPIEGLDCAHCALRVEQAIQQLPEIVHAEVNFLNKTVVYETQDSMESSLVFSRVQQAISQAEPHASLQLTKKEHSLLKQKFKFLFSHGNELGLVLLASLLTLIAALWTNLPPWAMTFILMGAYLLVASEVLVRAFRNLTKGKILDEHFLMSLATIGAWVIQEPYEAIAVMALYRLGEWFQSLAVERSRGSIRSLLDAHPTFVTRLSAQGEEKISPDKVQVGDHLRIKPGERLAVDGILASGTSELNVAALSGEPLPRIVQKGSAVFAGSINGGGVLILEVTQTMQTSFVQRMLQLMEDAVSKKTKTERLITRFAQIYTPLVVGMAVLLTMIPPLLGLGPWMEWGRRSLVFLVLACPCALVLSVPLGFFAGIGRLSKLGLVVKGSDAFESFAQMEALWMDKTGTLTLGEFSVVEIEAVHGNTEQLLEWVAHAEGDSTHPYARAIQQAWGKPLQRNALNHAQEWIGQGMSVVYQGHAVLVGRYAWLQEQKIQDLPASLAASAQLVVAYDGRYAGWIRLEDQPRADMVEAMQALRKQGVSYLAMLTGDQEEHAKRVAQSLGLDAYYANLYPEEKLQHLERFLKDHSGKGTVGYLGDGINDAPTLARADVGIAMGKVGSDAALEAADMLVLHDHVGVLAQGKKVAQGSMQRIRQNIIGVLVIKALVLLLGAWGYAPLWSAVFADVGVTLLAILNIVRPLKGSKNREH